MSQIHLHIPSFNAGELSPLLGARFGVEKVQSGCRRLRNFIIHPHGPAFRRPGMEYMGESMGSGVASRLQGFNFSMTTGYILEFHQLGLQVWDKYGRVQLKTPVTWDYTAQDCAELQVAQVNDVCYIAHPSYPPRKLVRKQHDEWVLSDVDWKWPPLGDENVREATVSSGTTTVLRKLPTYISPEIMVDGGREITINVTNPPGGTARRKKVLVERRLDNNTWDELHRFNWTTTGPSPAQFSFTPTKKRLFRVTYETKDVLAPGVIVDITWKTGPKPSEGGDAHTETISLDLGIHQPEIRTPVMIPAGEWQTTVQCPDIEVRPTSKIILQRKNAKGEWKDFETLKMQRGKMLVNRGPKLDEDEEWRFFWDGPPVMGGEATFESLTFPTSDDTTLQVDDKSGTGKKMTASTFLFKKFHVGSFWQLTHHRGESRIEIKGGAREIVAENSDPLRVQGKWELQTYGSWSATLSLQRRLDPSDDEWETVNSWTSRKDRNVIASGEELEPVELRLSVTEGKANTPDTPLDTPHRPRFELTATDGRINGLVKVVAVPWDPNEAGETGDDGVVKYKTAKVDVKSSIYVDGEEGETAMWTEGAWSKENGYPRTVTLHGQRLWFGGTTKEPLRLWGSVVNDYENFTRTSFDDASVSFTPAAQQQNAMQWITSHGTELIIGTTGDEWTLGGGGESAPITPTSVLVQRRSAYGSSYLPALLLGEVIVFVQRGGQKLRQVAPRATGIVWSAADLTVLAEHVARAGVKQIAIMNFPTSILWAVTNEGKLLGMTFEQEQNVFGWHVHDTDGRVESVAVVYGAEADEVWLAVERNGKRGIERLDPGVFARQFDQYQRLIYLDAARRHEVDPKDLPTMVVDKLKHLEGREVMVLGDGAELNPVRVVDGRVTLEKAVRSAIVGLPFTSELQPMRLEVPMQDGTAQNRMWRTARVGLFLHESIGGEIADGPEARFEKLQFRRISTPMDSAPALYSGQMETAIESKAREGADVVVRQSSPLPLNIGSITLKGDIYGE